MQIPSRKAHTATATRPFAAVATGLLMAATLTIVGVLPAAAQSDEMATDYAVLVRGPLFTDDLDAAQTAHDAVAAGGEEAARGAGDVYHLAGLSTTMLGGTEGGFLGVDRWNSPEAIEAFYSDPAIAEAFGSLFAEVPTIEVFQSQPDWHSWGELPVPSAEDERWIAVVRGRLAEADPSVAQQAHDAVAAAGQEAAQGAGDIAHVVYTGLADSAEFLAFDVWENADGIEAVYGNPDFQAAFASLFAEPPTLQIYSSTDWYQWP